MKTKEEYAAIMAERIKALMEEKHITLSRLYSECNINHNTIYSLKNSGIMPRMEKVIKIADLLDVSIDYLIGRTDNNISFDDNEMNVLHQQADILRKKMPSLLSQVDEIDNALKVYRDKTE